MENYKRSESIEHQLGDLLLLGINAKGCWLTDKPVGELLSALANIHCLSKKICQDVCNSDNLCFNANSETNKGAV